MSDEAKPYTTEEARTESARFRDFADEFRREGFAWNTIKYEDADTPERTALTLRAYADMLAEVGKAQDVLREVGCDAEVVDVFAAASLYPHLNNIINDLRTEITAQGERVERLRAALTDIRSRGLSARNGRAYDLGGIAHEALKEDDSHA